jgi:HlyD family secretion protein
MICNSVGDGGREIHAATVDEGRFHRVVHAREMKTTALMFLALLLATAACGRSASNGREGRGQREGNGRGSPSIPLVEALPARQGTLPLELRVSGVVRAANQVEIRPEISAMVAEVLVRSGDSVTRGQPLVRLDPDPQRQELRQGQASVRLAEAEAAAARARLTELEAQATRNRKLAERGVVSELERETVEAQVAAAQAAVKQGQARVDESRASVGLRRSTLDKTVLRSPISGRVGRREATEPGMLVTPSTVLFVVGDLTRVIVDVPLTEKMLARVRPGQPATLRGAALGDQVVNAALSRVSPFLAPGSFSTTGEIDVDNRDGRLLPGMFVAADIATGKSEQATLVPTSALWEDPRTGVLGVYVVDRPATAGAAGTPGQTSGPHPVKLTPVEVKAEGRATVGVAGVAPGQWVVTIGQHLLAAAGSDGAASARVRTVAWERVLALQARQQEDLLARFLEKQQRLARSIGVAPPSADSLRTTKQPSHAATP